MGLAGTRWASQGLDGAPGLGAPREREASLRRGSEGSDGMAAIMVSFTMGHFFLAWNGIFWLRQLWALPARQLAKTQMPPVEVGGGTLADC